MPQNGSWGMSLDNNCPIEPWSITLAVAPAWSDGPGVKVPKTSLNRGRKPTVAM